MDKFPEKLPISKNVPNRILKRFFRLVFIGLGVSGAFAVSVKCGSSRALFQNEDAPLHKQVFLFCLRRSKTDPFYSHFEESKMLESVFGRAIDEKVTRSRWNGPERG